MGQAFTTTSKKNGSARSGGDRRRKVLVTGAAGNIGSYFAEHSRNRYDLTLMVREQDDSSGIRKFGKLVTGDLGDLETLTKFCRGIDTVLHLAGDPSPNAKWESLLQNNIVGTYNVYVAAKAAGCRRVIYASSIHAVSGYPADVQVKNSEPVNPGDLYGVSKCFGEAMGRYMAEQEGLSSIAIRIGAFQPLHAARSADGIGMLDAFVSQRDLNHLIECCIDDEDVLFAIVHGLSNNRFKRMDISDTCEMLGYQPQDDLTEENVVLSKLKLREKVHGHNLTTTPKSKSGIRKELRAVKR